MRFLYAGFWDRERIFYKHVRSHFDRFRLALNAAASWLRGDWAGTHWARLFLKRENHPLKENFSAEPIAAPPACLSIQCLNITSFQISAVNS
ncbi:hypothetical protein EFP50_07935 [Lacticaseibacillus paracasei]|nr:hypothetical protein [Lacticaseibacillus paracasei]